MCVIDCVLSEIHKENSSGQISKGIQEEDINKTHTFPKKNPVYHQYNKLLIIATLYTLIGINVSQYSYNTSIKKIRTLLSKSRFAYGNPILFTAVSIFKTDTVYVVIATRLNVVYIS